MGAVSHLAPMIGFGFLGWIVAFLILITQKDKSHFVTRHAIQSLTFQFALFVWSIGCAVLLSIPIVNGIGFILAWIGGLAGIVLPVMGAIHSVRGQDYEYPIVGRIYRRSIS